MGLKVSKDQEVKNSQIFTDVVLTWTKNNGKGRRPKAVASFNSQLIQNKEDNQEYHVYKNNELMFRTIHPRDVRQPGQECWDPTSMIIIGVHLSSFTSNFHHPLDTIPCDGTKLGSLELVGKGLVVQSVRVPQRFGLLPPVPRSLLTRTFEETNRR